MAKKVRFGERAKCKSCSGMFRNNFHPNSVLEADYALNNESIKFTPSQWATIVKRCYR